MEIGRIEELRNPTVELLPDGSVRFQFWRVENFHGTQTDLALTILDWLKGQVALPREAPDFSQNPDVRSNGHALARGSRRVP